MKSCTAIVGFVPPSDLRECPRAEDTTCKLGGCGGGLCWKHAESCYECGETFHEACLEVHAIEARHQVDLPKGQAS